MSTAPAGQLVLFEEAPTPRHYGLGDISRKRDPASSRRAAAEHEKTGRRSDNLDRVAAALWAHPGSTSVEIHHHVTGLDRVEVSRRLPDAEKAGLVRRGAEGVPPDGAADADVVAGRDRDRCQVDDEKERTRPWAFCRGRWR